MSQFTPETPLGRAVQEILIAHPDGLRIGDIRRQLRLRGQHVLESNLLDLLRHPRTFALLSDGRYVLSLGTSGVTTREATAAGNDSGAVSTINEVDPWTVPLLRNLPLAFHDYVVFDLETMGTDTSHDEIIQIAALRIVDCQPVAMRNWYINPGREIPFSLKVALGMDKDPYAIAEITAAPGLNDVLPEFLEFIGDSPLVAYNARFDGKMLATALDNAIPINPLVDTLELAMLLYPNLSRHRLEDLAGQLGYSIPTLREEWGELTLDVNFQKERLSAGGYHNAIVDVYVLYRIHDALCAEFKNDGPRKAFLEVLLPEAFGERQEFQAVDIQLLESFRSACDWSMEREHTNRAGDASNSGRILVEYLNAKGYQPRPGQIEMQSHIEQALEEDRYAMVEAPTGTGKTLAYLSAAVHHALRTSRRIVLSTAYRNLQDQLLAEIDDLQELGPVHFRSQALKGINNYFCWTQIQRYLEDGSPERGEGTQVLSLSERYVLAYVVLWLPGSRFGTVDELSYWVLETIGAARSVVHQLRAGSGCNPGFEESCSACPMSTAYENAKVAEIVVLNHALWLSDTPRLPTFDALIIDEAHTLEDVATNALTREVSSETLTDLLHSLYDPNTQRGLLIQLQATANRAEIRSAVGGAMASVRRLLSTVNDLGPALLQFVRLCTGRVDPRYGAAYRLEAPPKKVHGSRFQRVDDMHRQIFGIYLQDTLQALSRLLQILAEGAEFPYRVVTLRRLSELYDQLAEQREFAYELLQVTDRKQVYWLAVGPLLESSTDTSTAAPQWWAMRSAPIDVGEALSSFYEKLTSVVFVSATLALRGNDFSFFVDRLGLQRRLNAGAIIKLPPALPYDEQVFLGLTNYLTYAPTQSTMESFKEELAEELCLFLQFTDGRSLGLFTARQRMEQIADQIATELGRNGIPLLVQRGGISRQRLLESFREREESVLFGLRSFWEGVDAPGQTLSFVLMEKLPFPLLIEPVHRARAEALIEQGRSEFDDYMLPLMLLQFKQGFGRLMRRDSDKGAVVLFDKRIHRKHYRADLLASLPGFLPRDDASERSRRRFYEKLASLFPDLIDLRRKQDLLLNLPEDILLDIDATLQRFTLPTILSEDDYKQWRPILLEALQMFFGHKEFRTLDGLQVQEDVIRHILTGKDVLGVLPTGAGKSLTFQLTALLRDGVTLVFSPLIALMIDQVAHLNADRIEIVGAIYSGQSASDRDDIFERMRKGRIRLVYISPERLRDPQLIQTLRQTNVIQIVVDEAHCVYMWGPSFRPDFLHLPRLFDLLQKRPPIAALTATATPEMRGEILQALNMQDAKRVIAPVDRPNLNFLVYNASSKYGGINSRNDRFKQLLRILQTADHERPSIIIYVSTTVEADQLARYLQVTGFDARAYHGKMEPIDRSSVQEMFMDDHINIVVCTKAFGMGIDKSDIRYVIHYNLPGDMESYFQEAGRAGRDGKPAYCILLYHKGDIGTQTYFIENSTPDEETINHVLNYLKRQSKIDLYLDPEDLQVSLGVTDVQLRVALHHLELQGFLIRDADFALTGSVTFQLDPQAALTTWLHEDETDADLLKRILTYTHWPAYRKLEIDFLALAASLQVAPDHIDRVLLRMSGRGEAVYRPWKRGFVLHKQPKMMTMQQVSAGALAAEQHRQQLHDKLKQIVAYAENNRVCRRASILQYFGQSVESPCGGCDVCEPEREWPWSLVTGRDFATPDLFFDPPFVVLETIHWNLQRASRYGAPYGTGTLLAILKGDSFSIGRFETEPHLKRWRLEQARSCPAWGVFATLPKKDAVLDETIQRLEKEAYIEEAVHTFDAGPTYRYLKLTNKGIEQLTAGKLLQWK